MNASEEKKRWRSELFQKRRELGPGPRASASAAMVTHVHRWVIDQGMTAICLFMPVKDEPNLTALRGLTPSLLHALPTVGADDSTLTFRRWDFDAVLVPNRFGIPEPAPASPEVHPNQTTLVLVPALGIDRDGNRLGYGGGFFDRYLPSITSPAMAVVFEACLIDRLPTEFHDHRMALVVTERGVTSCPARSGRRASRVT